jgi:hypothetical protein
VTGYIRFLCKQLQHTFHVIFVGIQVSGFLACKSDSVGSLLSFPAVAEAFRKCNATLPSSAAVERLFSAASQVLCARRCRMSDETLDKLVFLQSSLK